MSEYRLLQKKIMLLQKLFHPIVKVVGHDMNPADVVVGGSASAV